MLRRLFLLYDQTKGDDLIVILGMVAALLSWGADDQHKGAFERVNVVTEIRAQVAQEESEFWKQWDKDMQKIADARKEAIAEARRLEEAKKAARIADREKAAANAVDRSARSTTFVVTAYTAGFESTGKRPGDPGYGKTASGAHVQEGVTIACPKSIPFGTVIHIHGVGDRVCQDRGGAITEGRLDLYIADLGRAQQFGKQRLEATIRK